MGDGWAVKMPAGTPTSWYWGKRKTLLLRNWLADIGLGGQRSQNHWKRLGSCSKNGCCWHSLPPQHLGPVPLVQGGGHSDPLQHNRWTRSGVSGASCRVGRWPRKCSRQQRGRKLGQAGQHREEYWLLPQSSSRRNIARSWLQCLGRWLPIWRLFRWGHLNGIDASLWQKWDQKFISGWGQRGKSPQRSLGQWGATPPTGH